MKSALAMLLMAASAVAQPTVFFIRHGEKPVQGNGLSAMGLERAQCLRNVFGAASPYDIGHILAQSFKPDGSRKRPYDTVLPLATDLGLGVDTTCDRDDAECVRTAIMSYTGTGNILVCWEHKELKNLAKALGVRHNLQDYPDDRFDLIWTVVPDYKDITERTSENCPTID